jgi:hypothetical protein
MATKKYEKICDRCGVEAELLDDRIERGWIKAGFPAKSGFLGCGGIPPGSICAPIAARR